MRRRNRGHRWIGGGLIATAAALPAVLPLGSSGVAAAATSHESAPQLLRAACSATLAAPAFRAQGHVTTGGSSVKVDVYFGSGGELLTLTQHGNQTFEAIQNGPSTYIKGNGPFWRSTGAVEPLRSWPITGST